LGASRGGGGDGGGRGKMTERVQFQGGGGGKVGDGRGDTRAATVRQVGAVCVLCTQSSAG
jgi:hypothetical protein